MQGGEGKAEGIGAGQGPAAAMLRAEVPPEWNRLTERVIGLAMEVHSILGPGLLERLYEDALVFELTAAGIEFERQKVIRLKYKSIELSEQRLDLVVGGMLVLELKSVDSVADIWLAQLVSYLRSAHLPLGLLINFNVPRLKDGLYRRINPQACPRRVLPSLDSSPSSPSALL